MKRTTASSPLHLAVLGNLHTQGPATWVELEHRLTRAGLHRATNYLQQTGRIVGQPKKRGLLRVYEITTAGLSVLGLRKISESKCERIPDYVCTEMAPSIRPGAMVAYELPSRMGKRLHYRDGRVEVLA